MKEFYLTLPSNSSMGVFSNNTAAQYITKLSETIELNDDRWEVGLVEIIFPLSFHNIRNGKNKFVFFQNSVVVVEDETKNDNDTGETELTSNYYASMDNTIDGTRELELTPGHYSSIDHLTDHFNNLPELQGTARLVVNKITGHVDLKIANANAISFGDGLAEVLGFDTIAMGVSRGAKPSNLYIQVPQQLFLYSD